MILAHIAARIVGQAAQLAWILPPLVLIETIWPRAPISVTSRLRGLAFSAVYLLFTAAILTLISAGMSWLGIRPLFTITHPSLASAAAVTVFAALLSDFLYYWCHRAQHRWLWRYHAVHHAIRELNAVNAYTHWTEELMRLPFMTLPLALLVPAGGGWLSWITGLVVLQSYYLHSNTRLNFGRFGRIISDNSFHRLHHSIEPEHFDKNFGVLTPLWDRLFGTAHVPKPGEWPATGIAELPEVDGVGDYLLRPFRGEPASAPRPVLLD